MDTVIGSIGGKSLLTLHFITSNFMMAFLLNEHTKEETEKVFIRLKKIFGKEQYKLLFRVVLTDNGTEMPNNDIVEIFDNETVANIFYCDPGKSYQKGKIEKNHTYIRRALPKGTSFDNLKQEDIDKLMNNINSISREELNNNCPYDLAVLLIGKDYLKKLNYKKIKADEIDMNLLKK
jgi:IS30 family transposase